MGFTIVIWSSMLFIVWGRIRISFYTMARWSRWFNLHKVVSIIGMIFIWLLRSWQWIWEGGMGGIMGWIVMIGHIIKILIIFINKIIIITNNTTHNKDRSTRYFPWAWWYWTWWIYNNLTSHFITNKNLI